MRNPRWLAGEIRNRVGVMGIVIPQNNYILKPSESQ